MELSKLQTICKTAAFIAISSHMGTRSIFLFESYLVNKFGLDVQTDSKIEDSKNGD